MLFGFYGKILLLHALGFKDTSVALDVVVTGLLLVAGSDRIAQIQQLSGVSGSSPSKPMQSPIEITGKLTLEGAKGTSLSEDVAK